jgi:hypothetical protein
MTELYPQLGPAIDKHLKSDLHEIGFTGWVHLRKEKRDSRQRLTWTCPIEGYKDWFLVLLLLENNQLFIDLLKNPLGRTFDKTDVRGLVRYINEVVRKLSSCG